MRQPKPYFKKSHRAWYVNIDGRPVRLGPDETEAWVEYHKVMAGRLPVTERTPTARVLDQFLVWVQQNRATQTYKWYLNHLQSFADAVGTIHVGDLKAKHATDWLEKSYRDASDSYKNGACRALARAFNWAIKQGLIEKNPVRGLERPPSEAREAYLKPADWETLVKKVIPDDPFHDFLWFLHETGCRPLEARIAEAKHFDEQNARLVFERAKSKGKKRRRVVRLNTRALEIVRRLVAKYPKGVLFRNQKGKPWTRFSLGCRFSRLREKVSFEVFPYIFRHSWCTDALLRGVDPLTVAIFLGHKDATQVMKTYSHLVQQDEFLAAKLKQATGEGLSS